MQVGCLGSTVFNVSKNQMKTFTKFTRQGGVTYQTHARHLRKQLPEFTGTELETISFNMLLSSFLGASPKAEEAVLYAQMYAGAVMPLVIGGTYYGNFVIKKLKSTGEHTDVAGNFTTTNVSVTLQEYV